MNDKTHEAMKELHAWAKKHKAFIEPYDSPDRFTVTFYDAVGVGVSGKRETIHVYEVSPGATKYERVEYLVIRD